MWTARRVIIAGRMRAVRADLKGSETVHEEVVVFLKTHRFFCDMYMMWAETQKPLGRKSRTSTNFNTRAMFSQIKPQPGTQQRRA
jgi:hypothetical protein